MQLAGRASFLSFQTAFTPAVTPFVIWRNVKTAEKLPNPAYNYKLRTLFSWIQVLVVLSHLRDVYIGQKIHLNNKTPYALAVEIKHIITGSWD